MHTAHKKPDWEDIPESKRNSWQRIAASTNGILTPANIVSIAGFAIVIAGAIALTGQNWVLGLILVMIGRSFDLIDGFVAERTQTKSRLGEVFDTTSDKFAILVFYVVGLYSLDISLFLLAVLLIHHGTLAIYAVTFGRRRNIHPSLIGKHAMFFSWIAIFMSIINHFVDNTIIEKLTWLSVVVYTIYAAMALYTYSARIFKPKS